MGDRRKPRTIQVRVSSWQFTEAPDVIEITVAKTGQTARVNFKTFYVDHWGDLFEIEKRWVDRNLNPTDPNHDQ